MPVNQNNFTENTDENSIIDNVPPRGKLKVKKIISYVIILIIILAVFDGFFVEPRWVKLNIINLTDSPKHKIIQITDLHYKGEKDYLKKIIKIINNQKPDAVCITGDLIEDANYLTEVLELLSTINSPLVGVPGNHDYWSHADFEEINTAFNETGGKWLENESLVLKGINFRGAKDKNDKYSPPKSGTNVLLCHYPIIVDELKDRKYDLILAGHSHGGQVRLPFYGAIIVPYDVGKYELGMYETENGPLYVNSGLGNWLIPVRFFCRPEITVFNL